MDDFREIGFIHGLLERESLEPSPELHFQSSIDDLDAKLRFNYLAEEQSQGQSAVFLRVSWIDRFFIEILQGQTENHIKIKWFRT